MISIARVVADDDEVAERGTAALQALAARPGYLEGTLARSTDHADRWVLVTRWRDVGSYRRALGAYDVKLRATPLLAGAVDEDSAFEELVDVAPDGTIVTHGSDRA